MKFLKKYEKIVYKHKIFMCKSADFLATLTALLVYLTKKDSELSLVFLTISVVYGNMADNEKRFRKLEKESD